MVSGKLFSMTQTKIGLQKISRMGMISKLRITGPPPLSTSVGNFCLLGIIFCFKIITLIKILSIELNQSFEDY